MEKKGKLHIDLSKETAYNRSVIDFKKYRLHLIFCFMESIPYTKHGYVHFKNDRIIALLKGWLDHEE